MGALLRLVAGIYSPAVYRSQSWMLADKIGFQAGRQQHMHRIAIDVGGTFTDLVVSNTDGSARTLKLLSTQDDYSRAIAEGLDRLVRDGAIDPLSVGSLVHAFTVATNALVTGKGARVALLTTKGFRDVLEIARLRMPQLYNMDWDKPRPLVPRRLRFEIEERMDGDGEVVRALNAARVITVLDTMGGEDLDSVDLSVARLCQSRARTRRDGIGAPACAPHFRFPPRTRVPEIREYERNADSRDTFVSRWWTAISRRWRGIGNDRDWRSAEMVMQSSGDRQIAMARQFPAYWSETGAGHQRRRWGCWARPT
jgi:N-methylhydantoinase A